MRVGPVEEELPERNFDCTGAQHCWHLAKQERAEGITILALVSPHCSLLPMPLSGQNHPETRAQGNSAYREGITPWVQSRSEKPGAGCQAAGITS